MSVRNLGADVLKLANSRLRPLGFSKKGQTFSREREQYVERYLLEGSRWNSGEEPWIFTIEVGVFFPEIPTLTGAKGFWKHCHAVGNALRLVDENARDFEARSNSTEVVAADVVASIERASRVLPTLVGPVRQRALQGLISPLPIPSTWIES